MDDRARLSCLRGIPPNRATRSFLPSRRCLASRQVLGPWPVIAFALLRAAMLATEDLCLAARVFSIDVWGVPAQRAEPPDAARLWHPRLFSGNPWDWSENCGS